MGKIVRIVLLNILFFSLLSNTQAMAANATMELTPLAGSFGKPFIVDLVIDGHGEKFNAAQATVTLSPGLAIKDLTFGDCNFTFLKPPSSQNPSFAGGILGKYATKCTAYSLFLVPTTKGEATITLAKAKIFRYGDAANILATASGASYTLTAAFKASPIPTVQASQNGFYTASITVRATGKAVPNTLVSLTTVATKSTQKKLSDASGNVQFTNLHSGIYDVVVSRDKTILGEQIINISGANHTLTFSLNFAAEKQMPLRKTASAVLGVATMSPYFIAGILVFGVCFGTGLAILFLKWNGRRHLSSDTRV